MPETIRTFRLTLTEEEALAVRFMLGFGKMSDQVRGELEEMSIDPDETLAAVDTRLHSLLEGASGTAEAVTKEDLERARPWQVFEGFAVSPQPGLKWDLFGGFSLPDTAEKEMEKRHLELFDPGAGPQEPCKDDEAHRDEDRAGTQVSDLDACLAYLRGGGVLLFVPDEGEEAKAAEGKEVVCGRFVAVRRG